MKMLEKVCLGIAMDPGRQTDPRLQPGIGKVLYQAVQGAASFHCLEVPISAVELEL